ncbi:unnamed protein product [Schistosoma margrebowiei]|uniref:Uncharacterized protein n=1 Tax=Schistosoma margrebowiei TaxID=48269 RepID=A0A183N296_9TREM|nr:unnamed protein product [Schistosoma margrebowiei]
MWAVSTEDSGLIVQSTNDSECVISDPDPLKSVNWNARRHSVANRRHVELVGFSDTLSKMYHGVLHCVMELYRDDRDCQISWQHFRNAADKLAEMHKYVKLTILKVYELGIVEGAASFSSDFFDKIRDMPPQDGNRNIPFDCVQHYLSRPDDPPPKSLRRIKRVAVRRRSRHLRNVGEIIEHHLHPTSVNSKQTESGSSSYAHQPSTLEWDAGKHSNWTVIQKTSSCMSLDTEIDCPSEDSGTSLSSCTCDDYLTDTSNSTNEEDD